MVDDMPVTWWGKMVLRYDLLRYDMNKIPERVCVWIAWRMPRQLVMWAAIRLMAHATTGKNGSRVPDRVSIMDALRSWEK